VVPELWLLLGPGSDLCCYSGEKNLKLYLIRHGESANNLALSSTGGPANYAPVSRVPDPELTETGHKQARLLADHLVDPQGDPLQHPWLARKGGHQGFGLTHVYCSLMVRSILTAQYIARVCGLPLMADANVFERHGIYEETADGTKTGLPGSDRNYLSERFPDLELPHTLGHGGWYDRSSETDESFLERAKIVALDFVRRHVDSDDSVAMVIHGDLIDQLINELTGAGRHPDNYDNHWTANWAFHNTSVTRIDFVFGSRAVVYTNRLQHLPPDLVTW